jgi:hypothetical protein
MWNPSGWDKNSRNVGVVVGAGVAADVVVVNGSMNIQNNGKWVMIMAKDR